jgi:ribosomal protein S17E
MPIYDIEHPKTGQKITLEGDGVPTDADIREAFALIGKQPKVATAGKPDAPASETERMKQEWLQREGGTGERIKQNAKSWVKAAVPYVRTVAEGLAAAGGGLVGLASPVPGGAVIGAGLGYAGAKNLMDTVEGNWAATPKEAATRTLADLGTGAMFEMGGQAVAPALSALSGGVGKVVKPLLGKLSGVGESAIDEAIKSGAKATGNPLKSSTGFDRALRGNTDGEEIVSSARDALNSIKNKRSNAYQGQLREIEQQGVTVDTRPIKQEVSDLMAKYNVKVDPVTGGLDTSRIAMGKTGRNDIKDIIETVSSWGTKAGDNTAIGLDTLKRQLDDFYSDSSQARQFVTQIRNKVKDTIVSSVPEYNEMTKGYTEATKLIKDVESGLMMRKQGMSGRITADQTLRRLTSAMKDNFELRKDLVEILGAQANKDLSGDIAGYTMNTTMPRGLAGTGTALAGSGYAAMINPSFWPVLAASSPRVQGEFLRLFGRGMNAASKIPKQAISNATRQVLIQSRGGSDAERKTVPSE